METFSAVAGQPAIECMEMAAAADAVICIVAHRYGYVPPPELGGDGEHSITWLEVDAAMRAGKPVFAFLINPHVPWPQPNNEDGPTYETAEASSDAKSAQKLTEFKDLLDSKFITSRFSSDEELAKLVAVTIANFSKHLNFTTFKVKRWKPLFYHALQPAVHFRGRLSTLHYLKGWLESRVTANRVISLVAPGGTGKTALVERALHEAKLSDRSGVFVWSFYEDPKTDEFLRAACTYFTGKTNSTTSGMLERLQISLSGDVPHTLVLDGLERVQSEGGRRRRGELEDPQLKRLLRSLSGGTGAARALVTSRFPIVDLEPWVGYGHGIVILDDLELPAALDLLRDWQVRGDDAALAQLLEPLNIGGLYHALSVAVMGSYIGKVSGGDPSRAPKFSLKDAEDFDPKAERLNRILEEYSKALTPTERDLLARLSLFTRGVKVEFLSWIVKSGGEVAGTLVGLTDQKLLLLLERLKEIGLVFRYEAGSQISYSTHPFLREFFRSLLTAKPEFVHESIRARLARSLNARPGKYPNDPSVLDQYELLIEETLLAGRVQDAFDLYWYGLGAYANLGAALGDFSRGLRILQSFLPEDDFSIIEDHLPQDERAILVNAFGLFASKLGELGKSRLAFDYAVKLSQTARKPILASIWLQNLAEVELNAGHFPSAQIYAKKALRLAEKAKDRSQMKDSYLLCTSIQFALGKAPRREALRAEKLLAERQFNIYGIEAAQCSFLRGDDTGAQALAHAILEFALDSGRKPIRCRADALLARILAGSDPVQANKHLENARSFADDSEHIELRLRCFQAAGEFELRMKNLAHAIAETESGILLADTFEFGRYSIDLRLILAQALLAAQETSSALKHARDALDRSRDGTCSYAWGQADGLHVCGLAHLQCGKRDIAREALTAALKLRRRIGHGRVAETVQAINLCAMSLTRS